MNKFASLFFAPLMSCCYHKCTVKIGNSRSHRYLIRLHPEEVRKEVLSNNNFFFFQSWLQKLLSDISYLFLTSELCPCTVLIRQLTRLRPHKVKNNGYFLISFSPVYLSNSRQTEQCSIGGVNKGVQPDIVFTSQPCWARRDKCLTVCSGNLHSNCTQKVEVSGSNWVFWLGLQQSRRHNMS